MNRPVSNEFTHVVIYYWMCEVGMKELPEITILKEGNIKITNKRAIMGMKTYALSKLVSVHVHEDEPRLFLPVFYMLIAAICSALVAVSNMDDYSHFLTNSLYIAIIGFLLFLLSRKTKYSVRVRSATGEMIIWVANDMDSAERIVAALNKAISLQGSFAQSQGDERATIRH